jgi:uncharacterized protein YbaP (TraB family)
MRAPARLSALLLILVPLRLGADPAAGEKRFLWKVSSDKGHAWLLGSIHVAKPDLYPLPKEITAAFEASKALVVEADQSKMDPAAVQKMVIERGFYKPGDPRPAEERQKAARDLAAKVGIPAPQADLMKPWFLSLNASVLHLQKLGFDPKHGIDRHFMDAARAKGTPIKELESAQFQLDLLSGFSDDLQALFVASTLEDLDGVEKKMEKIFDTWKRGDAPGLEALVITEGLAKKPEMAPLKKKLLDDRNVGMAAKVEEYLKTGEVHFVVMGSAHLLGETGVADLLRKKGYKVEQVEGN